MKFIIKIVLDRCCTVAVHTILSITIFYRTPIIKKDTKIMISLMVAKVI